MPEHDELLHDLGELGRSVPTPGAVGMDEAVLARLAETAPAPTRRPRTLLRVAAVALTTLLALLLVPPVRAAISDWFGFGSVMVREGDGTGELPTGSPSPSGPSTSLRDAAAQVTFTVVELPALGAPQGAWVSPDKRVLTLLWADGIRLDQSSSLSYTFAKTAESFEQVSVDGGTPCGSGTPMRWRSSTRTGARYARPGAGPAAPWSGWSATPRCGSRASSR